jgi:DNA-binding PadR family transcriptional regulator
MSRHTPPPDCTDAELLLLGLVAEMPRHGYQIEQELEGRRMREWTRIGFSSIYFVLAKLERAGLVSAKKPAGARARKTFTLTVAGRRTLIAQTRAAIRVYRPTHPSLLLGMINWAALDRRAALEALEARGRAVKAELGRLEAIQADQQPQPDYLDALFDFSIGQLEAETKWIGRTLAYMRTKPWLG